MERVTTYSGVRATIFENFNALADYIWKAPRLIQRETEIERNKLEAYFPLSEAAQDPNVRHLRLRRWQHEGDYLRKRFPTYMAGSNLFLAASTFEHHLLDIAIELQTTSQFSLAEEKGNGCQRLFNYFRRLGHSPEIGLWGQIDAAITLRNALLHADGRLTYSRERRKIERICNDRLFLEPSKRRHGGMADDNGWGEVEIVAEGNHLRINNYYAFRAVGYFKRFLLDFSQIVLGLDQ